MHQARRTPWQGLPRATGLILARVAGMDGDRPSTTLDSRRILENLTTAVVLLDARLCVAYLNPACEQMFALSARQAARLPLAELIPGARALEEGLRRALASGQAYTERELPLELPDRETITVDCTVTPMLEGGDGPGLLLELAQVDRHLRIAREEQLIAQQHATRALVRGLAHEIKNPLGGLRGAAQLLERELPDARLREYTAIIITEADRLRSLVDRMLGPSERPRKRPISIHQVLEHVRGLVQAEAPGAVRLLRDYDPSIPEMHADPDQLIQAVLNVVRNAVQAVGAEGEITLRTRTLRQFTIGQRRHRLVVRIDVSDDGPGIPADMIEQVFYPMVTGRAEGTGLGLPIAQSLLSQLGGLIECTSRPGRTVFTLLIPLEAADE
jgi:two-component system, NtrC family, nitrogen regulation sensor histidine kinase GlnL